MTIRIKTYNEILGDLIRKIIIDTPINDLNEGSVSTVLLEAIADSDFETSTSILSLLNLSNLDALNGVDLDNKGNEFGVYRIQAQSAKGRVTITDSSIIKESTSLYSLKLPPIKGSSTLYVTNVVGWSNSGTLYIGRGTSNFEGPITYSSIVNNGTFYSIVLSSSLNNDHLLSEEVTNAQNTTDRYITAGTIVKIDANDQNPAILYRTIRQATVYAGETTVTNIDIVAQNTGSVGNVSKNTIINFQVLPFIGAIVTNPSSTSQGLDREDDTSYRNRVKNFAVSLANGTKQAIVEAVTGVSDIVEGTQVTTAFLTEPLNLTSSSILYVNDSNGLQPSYEGQAYDILVQKAIGKEKFLQLTNFPLPRPQLVCSISGPYTLKSNDILTISVDGITETIPFLSTDFINIAFASLPEVITVINKKSILVNCRLTDNSNYLLIYPKSSDAEKIQVISPTTLSDISIDANIQFGFSTVEKYGIKLYRNSILLNQKERAASLNTTIFSNWAISLSGSLILSVDGTTDQTITFYPSDFATGSFLTATLSNWIDVFNKKIAGISASASSDGRLIISSNKSGDTSSIKITGGTYFSNMFSGLSIYSIGQTSDYVLNRQNGTIQLNFTPNAGDLIIAGAQDTKGANLSKITTTGTYDLSMDSDSRNSTLILVTDSDSYSPRSLGTNIGDRITVDSSLSPLVTMTSNSIFTFSTILPDDYLYISYYTDNSSFPERHTGLFKVISKGNHLVPGVDTYVQIYNINSIVDILNIPINITIKSLTDILAFSSDVYPQVWQATSMFGMLASESLSDIVDSLNSQTINIKSSVYQGNRIKVTSSTENGGSIAVAIVTGKASSYWTVDSVASYGNYSHTAVKTNDINVSSFFRRTSPIASPYQFSSSVDRYTFNELHDTLSLSTISDNSGIQGYQDRFSSTIFVNTTYNDYINFIERDNEEVFKTIQAFPLFGKADTQYGELPTLFHNIANVDKFDIIKMSEISDNDTLVITMDGDDTYKNVDINFYRAGKINTGSNSSLYSPTLNSFSADDIDNESGIDFSNAQVWDKTLTGAEFKDYAIWFRSRNYYSSGGIAAGLGKLLVRATEFGPYGDKLRFQIEYPTSESTAASYSHVVSPDNTLFTYYFGSTAAKSTGIVAGTQISVAVVGGAPAYRYTFTNIGPLPPLNFGSIVAGDILNISSNSGVSAFNRGIFRITNVGAAFLDLVNITGAITGAGTTEQTSITTIADVIGTPGQYTFDCSTISIGHDIDGKYFVVEENAGTTKYWYDISGTTVEPAIGTTTRSIRISSVLYYDTAAFVAQKTAYAIAINSAISTTVTGGTTINCTNTENKLRNSYSAGTSTFTLLPAGATGTNPVSLDGTFFIMGDSLGLVKVWLSTSSSTLEPTYGLPHRSLHVSLIPGETANNCASKITTVLNSNPTEFSASAVGSAMVINAASVGARTNATDSITVPTGFTILTTADGSDAIPEVVIATNTIKIYSLDAATTNTGYIATTVNNSAVVLVTDVAYLSNTPTITVATRDELITVAYGHNPSPMSGLNSYISLVDGENWVKFFKNSNPNFILKNNIISYGFPASIYKLDTAINWGTTDTGEYFRLIPRSIDNIYHHLTHKALSQLSIIGDISVSNDRKKIQIKSKIPGSDGSVSILGGTASTANLPIIGSGTIENYLSSDYLKITTNAFPFVYNVGDSVELTSLMGTKRRNFLSSSDTIDVINKLPTDPIYGKKFDYRYNAKVIFSAAVSTYTITPVTTTYFGAGSPATGIVWRWTFTVNPTGLGNVVPGDVLIANGTFSGFASSNTYGRTFGDGFFPGYPIVGVSSTLGYIDIINPYGVTMAAPTFINVSTDYLAVHPTPNIEFKLQHSSYINIAINGVVGGMTPSCTITTEVDHYFNTGDTIYIIGNSTTVAPFIATVLTVPTATSFTFSPASPLPGTGGRVGKAVGGSVWTKYKIQKMGFKNLVKLSWVSGAQPWFSYCGVGIDDYIKISGQTFDSENTGLFRVRGVYSNTNEDYVIFENENAVNNTNTVTNINYRSLEVNWVNNSNIITSVGGVAGAFENIAIGDWVKKIDDEDIYYQQVASFAGNTGNAYDATQLVLASPYRGTSATIGGLGYDQINGVNAGVYLMNPNDITFYEADSCIVSDTLSISSISDSSWFGPNNTGTFEIIENGTGNSTNNLAGVLWYAPFIRVYNNLGIDTLTFGPALMSVSPDSINIYENVDAIYSSIREVTNVAIDPNNINQRIYYLSSSSRTYKITDSNQIFLKGIGKLDYNSIISTGIDGYEYYTGLVQKVQWTVDGYSLDPTSYPGIKSVGSKIETIPSLIRNIVLSLDVTFTDGININDATNNIKVVISNYINTLDIGEDVILSEIIYNIMKVRGVQAATFTYPTPSTERISINEYESAYISMEDINIA